MFRCVRGDINQDTLGYCQIHEHVYVQNNNLRMTHPALIIDQYALSLLELKAYRSVGGTALVDAQPIGAGRQIDVLSDLSKESQVHIIAATGYHLPCFYGADHWIHSKDEDILAALFADEITQGAYQDGAENWPEKATEARAGIVKAAISEEGLTPYYRRLLGAAGQAAAKQRTALMLHTEKGLFAEEAIDFLGEKGLAPEQIIICHADRDLHDFDLHARIAGTGAYLDYDTIARPQYHTDQDEINHILKMVAAGYADRIMLSLDTTSARLRSYGGSPGLDFLITGFWPSLRAAGLDDQDYMQMADINPSQALMLRPAGHTMTSTEF